jgi:hypothetical protein
MILLIAFNSSLLISVPQRQARIVKRSNKLLGLPAKAQIVENNKRGDEDTSLVFYGGK